MTSKKSKNKTYGRKTVNKLKNMYEFVEYIEYQHKEKIAIQYLKQNDVIDITYGHFVGAVKKISGYLTEMVGEGKHIALIGDISYEWLVSFYGIIYSGGIVVPIDKQLAMEDMAIMIEKAECDGVIFNNKSNSNLLENLYVGKESLKLCLTFFKDSNLLSVEEILLDKTKDLFKKIYDADEIENKMAAIIFTSGTTGNSKGVILTHKNLIAGLYVCYYMNGNDFKRTIPVLPPNHMYEISAGIQTALFIGATICIGKGVKYLSKSIQIFKPSVLILVPMIVEMLHSKIWREARRNGKEKVLKRLIFLSQILLKVHIDIRNVLFKKVRESLGGELETIICGGAPVNETLIKDFQAFGIEIMNGYGVTECSPVIASNTRKTFKVGSVGTFIPEFCDVKIDANNEILVKGDVVSPGYYNDPEETDKSFSDGWFRTGDLGYFDDEGYLFLTGRIKNLIILDNGENVSPEEIEGRIKENALVQEVLVHVVRNKSHDVLAASIFMDAVYILENDIENPEKLLEEYIETVNESFPVYKRIQKIFIQDKELEKTSSGKLKRNY